MITDPKDPKSVVDPDPHNFERYPGSASASNKKQDPDQSDKLDPESPGSDSIADDKPKCMECEPV